MKTAAVLILAALTLTACGERVQGAPENGADVQVPAFVWRVRSARDIAKTYGEAGKVLNPGQSVDGFIGKQGGRVVIYTAAPKYVDDAVACTLGHEVMHAAIGDYHTHREAK